MDWLKVWLTALFCAASPASAQEWQSQTVDGGHFVFHTARANVAVDLLCLGPSPQGKMAVEVEQHEIRPMVPDMTRIEIGMERIPVGNAMVRSDVVLWADQVGYRLPPLIFNEIDGVWQVDISTADSIWTAVAEARSVILAPGQDQAWQLPVAGFGAAIADVQEGCAATWRVAQTPAVPAGAVTVPQAVLNRVNDGCGAPTPLPPNAVQAGDLDRDGTPDFVVDWNKITCRGPYPRPFCGAANCSQMVFVSTRAFVNPVDFLGTSLTIVPHAQGGLALRLTGSMSLCGAAGEKCAAPLVWDGVSFVERP